MDAALRPRRSVSTFLVERYWPGVTLEAFADAAQRVRESVDRLRGEGTSIRTLSSTLVPEDEAAYWVVEAPSSEVVALAYARAGVPIERIVHAVESDETGGWREEGES